MNANSIRLLLFNLLRIPFPPPSPTSGLASLAGLLLILLSPNGASAAAPAALPPKATPNDLYQMTQVWDLHLSFTPEQWTAMEPKDGGGGFFGGPGGGRRGGGRGGFGGFGPSMMLAPAFLTHGDENKDGSLSKAEFESLGAKWFAAWDKTKSGKLSPDQLRDGLSAALPPPPAGPPGGGRGFSLQGQEGRRNGLASAAGIEFEYVRADLDFAGAPLKNVAVRYKGNGTWMQSRGALKRSLKIDINKFIAGQKIAGVTTINLHSSITDASWMNEVLSHRLYRDAGVAAPRTSYARVFVTVPGTHDKTYLGVYSLVENVDENFAETNFKAKKGAILKPVTREPFAFLGEDWAKYNQTYDPKTDLSSAQKQRIIDFCRLVTSADDAEFAAKLESYVDLDQFSKYMAVTTWLATMDSILSVGQNYYVYLHPKTGKFNFIPWDLDHSFGQFGMMGSQEQREKLSIHQPWQGEIRFLERVFRVEAFKSRYLAALTSLQNTVLNPERFHQQVDAIALAIRPSVAEESAEKLARFDKVAAGEPVPPAGFGGTSPRGGGREGNRPGGGPGGFGFMQPPKPIKGFVTARAQSVSDQLAGKSSGETVGGFGPMGGGPGGRGGQRGGPGGPGGPGRQGGPGGFGPGGFFARAMETELDADKNQEITRAEFMDGFAKWFSSWDAERKGVLTDEQLRAGLDKDLSPFRGPPPGGPGSAPQDAPRPGN